MSYAGTDDVKGQRCGGRVRYDLLVRIFAGVRYGACGCVDGARCVGIENTQSEGVNVQDGLGLSCDKEMGAVLVGSEGATRALGGSERE